MLIKATQKNTRQSPRKVRLVANTVKKLSLEKAMAQLAIMERKASEVVAKTLRQAVANATHNHGYQLSDLSIDSILVNEGPRYSRFNAVSRGRAHSITKRTSHVTVIFKTNETAPIVKPAAKPVAAVAAPTEKATKEVKPASKSKTEKPKKVAKTKTK